MQIPTKRLQATIYIIIFASIGLFTASYYGNNHFSTTTPTNTGSTTPPPVASDTTPIESIVLLSNTPSQQGTEYTLTFEANEDVNSSIIGQTKNTTKLGTFTILSVNQKQFTIKYNSPIGLSGTPSQRKDTLTFDLFDLSNNYSILSFITPTLVAVDTTPPSEPYDFPIGEPYGNRNDIELVLTETGSGLDPNNLSVQGLYGGTVSNIRVSGLNKIIFDYQMGAEVGDALLITGKDKAGNSFSIETYIFYY